MGHDGHVAVSCAHCRSFVLAYPGDQHETRLRGWGYCRRPGGAEPPPAEVIVELRTAVLGADARALLRNRAALYRSDPEDGCEYFREAVATPGAVSGGR